MTGTKSRLSDGELEQENDLQESAEALSQAARDLDEKVRLETLAERLLERRRAPEPRGPISGRRTGLRRLVARATARINQFADFVLPSRPLHRLLLRGLEVEEKEIHLSRGAAGLDGLRIAFISDVHAGSCMNAEDLVRLFTKVAELKPDLVCFGGDLINTRERELLLFREALAMLDAPLGQYAVPGNHDHFWGQDIGLWEAFLQEHGVRVLNNAGARIERDGDTFWLAGVDDLTEGVPDLEVALSGAREDEPILLLSHHPDFFYEAAAVGVDVQLSGHTHGGQVKLFGWSAVRHSRFGWHEGSYELEGSQLYVGRGLGVTFLPMRLGASPELPIFVLRTLA
ncbi:MAG: phosphoesterase [Planctomycetota bacterium]|nr:MAG: phosphoesterase [Planctomycetota bacterium]